MTHRVARFFTFRIVVWVLAVLGCVWILGTPFAQNAWARAMWRQTPCDLRDSGRFSYDAGGKHYLSTRTNFWTMRYNADEVPKGVGIELAPNATCWVSPSNPDDAVLYLDAWQRNGEAIGRFATAIMVLAAAALITLFGTRRQPAGRGESQP